MNPVKQIGRYQLPICNVVAISRGAGINALLTSLGLWLKTLVVSVWHREGLEDLREWPHPGYNVVLNNGHVIHFTVAERSQYDEEMTIFQETLKVYGMARGVGLRA